MVRRRGGWAGFVLHFVDWGGKRVHLRDLARLGVTYHKNGRRLIDGDPCAQIVISYDFGPQLVAWVPIEGYGNVIVGGEFVHVLAQISGIDGSLVLEDVAAEIVSQFF